MTYATTSAKALHPSRLPSPERPEAPEGAEWVLEHANAFTIGMETWVAWTWKLVKRGKK